MPYEDDCFYLGYCKNCQKFEALKNGYCIGCQDKKIPDFFNEMFGEFNNEKEE